MQLIIQQQLLEGTNEDQKKKDYRSQMKLFIKQCPKYIVNNKIQLPVLDEYIREHDLVFQPEQMKAEKPIGRAVEVFCINPLSDMFEVVTFLNNFPVSPPFSILSDTLPLSLSTPLTMTAFMKIFVQLQCVKQLDIHDLNTILIQQETGATYKIESDVLDMRNDIHFQLVTFFIEEIMRFRQGLFTQAEVHAKKKAKKVHDRAKKSLKSMIEEMEVKAELDQVKAEQEEVESSPEKQVGGLSMTIKEDVQGSVFWDFIHELFFNQVNLGLKLRRKFKQDGVDLEEEFQGSAIDSEKFKKRQRFAQQLNAKKLKSKYKSQVKFLKFMKRNEYDNGCILQKTEKLMFKKMLRCFSQSWVEFLRQSLKISLMGSYFSKEAMQLIQNDLLREEAGGYFNLTQSQKGLLLTHMIDAVHNLDSFRTIVEYREEVCQELSKELEEAIGALNDHKMDAMLLDPSQMVDASRGDKESPPGLKERQEQQRLQCKKLLQLSEYSQMWINGATLLGHDVDNANYYLFANQTDKIFIATKDAKWHYYKSKEIESLRASLNLNGCKERELHRAIQKCEAYEILQDEETKTLLKKGTEQFYSNNHQTFKIPTTIVYDNKHPLLAQVKQSILAVENRLSLFLMNSKCRWASLKARKEFKSTLENLVQFNQLKEFVQFFVESLDTVESLQINTKRLTESASNLKDSDYKYLNAVSAKKEVNNDTIFQDLKLFELMEQLGVIEHQSKVKLKLWTYSGEKIKYKIQQNLKQKLVDSLYSLHFLVNVLLFTIEQYSYFELEGDVYQDQELANYATQLEKEERQIQKQLYRTIPKEQLIEIE